MECMLLYFASSSSHVHRLLYWRIIKHSQSPRLSQQPFRVINSNLAVFFPHFFAQLEKGANSPTETIFFCFSKCFFITPQFPNEHQVTKQWIKVWAKHLDTMFLLKTFPIKKLSISQNHLPAGS